MSGKVSVETPEQIRFEFELAGAGSRMLAYLIDLSIRAGIVSVIVLFLGMAVGWALPELASGLTLLVLFAVEWGYHTLIEWLWNGYTPGKRALRIRVVRSDGVGLDFVRSAMRNLLRAADLFPLFYATGLLAMYVTGSARRLGDFAADTMVVRVDRPRLRDLPPLPADAEPLPAGSLAALRLRDRDLAMIDELFRRRHLFSRDRARELAETLALPVARKLEFEGEDPELLLAGMLLAGHEVRSSWYGRTTAISAPPETGTEP
ncbi:MAG: RDD family protein [Polyangia bacterium]